MEWSCTADCDTEMGKDGYYYVYDHYDFDFYTVTATYYYKGVKAQSTFTFKYTMYEDNTPNQPKQPEYVVVDLQPKYLYGEVVDPQPIWMITTSGCLAVIIIFCQVKQQMLLQAM